MHQGEKIKELMDETGVTVAQLSKAVPMTEQGVYNLFKRKSIKEAQYNCIIGLIANISKVSLVNIEEKNQTDESMKDKLLREKDARIETLEKMLAMYEKMEALQQSSIVKAGKAKH